MSSSYFTTEQLERHLRTLGLQAGDTIMLHASVRAVGWIVGGPDALLRTILKLLGADGTLMMLTSWEDHPYELADWSAERQAAYLEFCPAFDPLTSRADHRELSILAEYLRTHPDAKRSAHPLSSYAAVGRHAVTLTEHHALLYHHGVDSPLARFCALEGKILLLGDLFDNITLLHHAEHLAQFANKRIVRYQMPILQNGTPTWVQLEEFDTDEILDGVGEYFGRLVLSFQQTHGNQSKVGNANAYLYDADQLLEYAVSWMETNLSHTSAPSIAGKHRHDD